MADMIPTAHVDGDREYIRRRSSTPLPPRHFLYNQHHGVPPPTDNLVGALLTDLYQITMCYAYWQSGKHNEYAVFDLFFRKNPFSGEYTIFAGLDEVLRFLEHFKVTDDDIAYLREQLPDCEEGFWDWFQNELDVGQLRVYSLQEGTVCFPRVPLMRVEGPLAAAQLIETTLLCLVNYATLMVTNASRFRFLVGDTARIFEFGLRRAQLLETTLLNLVNYPSLMTTNAVRYRLLAGPSVKLIEFGLRRAQGPDGGVSASKYSYLGGCDGTSNVLAGKLFGIPISGTHAHAFISSFTDLSEVRNNGKTVLGKTERPFLEIVLELRAQAKLTHTNDGELAAFVDYALSFPRKFLALVDTYDTLESGVPNFLLVAAALRKVGFDPIGVRLDSGDLAYLSKETRRMFKEFDEMFPDLRDELFRFGNMNIVASNDINEATLTSLYLQGHEINTFGIGTNLVTCQAQPALGCVYKLVEIAHKPRIKLSNEIQKVTLPGRKKVYRLYGHDGIAMLDLLKAETSETPREGERVLCRHPFVARKRAYVVPTKVVDLLKCVWADGHITQDANVGVPLPEVKRYVEEQLETIREDVRRLINPTPYKVSVTEELYEQLHELWLHETPIPELH